MEISVIIPVYNAARFVEQAVRSALDQPEVREVLVIDDGSTDDSLAIIQQLVIADSRVQVFQHPGGANRGPGASRNIGLAHATCPYITFLDADDYYLPQRFAVTKQVFAEHPEADGVYECVENVFLEESKIENVKDRPGFGLNYTLPPGIHPDKLFETLLEGKKGSISIIGLTLKTKLIMENEWVFREDLWLAQDVDFIFRLLVKAKLFGGSTTLPVVRRLVTGANNSLNQSLLFDSRILFHKDWFQEMLHTHFPAKANWYFLKFRLHYHPLTRPVVDSWLRFPVKGLLLGYYLIAYPRLWTKLWGRKPATPAAGNA